MDGTEELMPTEERMDGLLWWRQWWRQAAGGCGWCAGSARGGRERERGGRWRGGRGGGERGTERENECVYVACVCGCLSVYIPLLLSFFTPSISAGMSVCPSTRAPPPLASHLRIPLRARVARKGSTPWSNETTTGQMIRPLVKRIDA